MHDTSTSVLVVGAGGMTSRWRQLVDPSDYRFVAVLNGAIQAGTPCTHAFSLDPNAIQCDWWEQLCRTATHSLCVKLDMKPYADALAPEGVKVEAFGLQSWASLAEGWLGLDPRDKGKLVCVGTGLHGVLHYFSWEPGISQIDTIGCDLFLDERTDGTYYHFYDTQPIAENMRKLYDLNFSAQRHVTARIVETLAKRGITVSQIGGSQW